MIKTFLIGAIPLGLFTYTMVFHAFAFLVTLVVITMGLVAYIIGQEIQDNGFFN